MKYDKINFLYKTPASPLDSQMFSESLEKALRKNNLLYYVYDLAGGKPLIMKELLKYPILCVNGSWEPLFSIIKLVDKKQFIAEINTEVLFNADHYRGFKKNIFPRIFRFKKYFNILKSGRKRYKEFLEVFKILFKVNIIRDNIYTYKLFKKRSKFFGLYFSAVDEDLDKYFGKPCYWYTMWVDIKLLDDIAKSISDKILFVGALHEKRKKFLNQDKNKIIEIKNTLPKNNPEENVRELCKLVNKYRYTICPVGVTEQYIPGKIFEYLACKRLCFCYLPEGRSFRVKQIFKNGEEIVYFKNFQELEEKYSYYLENSKEAERIAQAGYEKVRKYHNADIRAKRFAEIVLYHANGGEYNESFDDISLFGRK